MAKDYTGVIFPNATFPDSPYKITPIILNKWVTGEYIPALEKALPNASKGLRCLLIAMTHIEGFKPGTRSYRNNNPGNIGNTDSGANLKLPSLEAGIKLQAQFIQDIIDGKKKAYPIGKEMTIYPFFSKEIADNPQYGLPSHLPGYHFNPFTGQLDQFVKIYSSGARATNSYINTIVSYLHINGIEISPTTTLQDIVNMG